MRKLLTILSTLLFISTVLLGQVNQISSFNANSVDNADPERPWANTTNHIRGAYYADDLDNDGKKEVLAVDYSNGGRVHVLEYNDGILELVWSSPILGEDNPNSTPRWVQSGDLDGDGMKEIIFPSGARYEGSIQVFEFTGTDNDYGTQSIIDFPATLHESNGMGTYRMDRERGIVYDLDGDGQSELITANYDQTGTLPYRQNVYILSINGNAPGFASWQIEGGDPNVHPVNGLSAGSWWQSIPVDYDGDGTKEIVNHYWNFFGFWSIEPTGPDSYTYPTAANPDGGIDGPVYVEYLNGVGEDGVSYMGINAADLDGDGNEEMFGSIYVGGTSAYNYDICVVDLAAGSDGIEVWNQDQFGVVADTLWKLLGLTSGDYWGTGAADIDGDGMDEMVLGGSPGRVVSVLDYNGSGSLLDGANYTASLHSVGEPVIIGFDVYDSLGTTWTDTSFGGFIARMDRGDINNNGKDDLLVAYQSIDDSVATTYYTWDTDSSKWDEDRIEMALNENAINIRIIEGGEATGIRAIDLSVITPDDYTLEQNYPNPFNPTTAINFSLPLNKKVSLRIYDMLGKEVKTLIDNEEFAKGSYEATWDATNNFGRKVVSGNYIATLEYGNFSKSIKMTLVK